MITEIVKARLVQKKKDYDKNVDYEIRRIQIVSINDVSDICFAETIDEPSQNAS